MRRTICVISTLLVIGCSAETTAPAPNPAPSTPMPEPTATASLDAGAAPLLVQPICASWSAARAVRALPQLASWFATPCPDGRHVEICNSSEASDVDPLPDHAVWFDGQPNGASPACVPENDTGPLTCMTVVDCPTSPAECWEPWCNEQTHQCMLTFAFKLGTSCADGEGICNIDGELRGTDGFKISLAGWPAICDTPQFPDVTAPAQR